MEEAGGAGAAGASSSSFPALLAVEEVVKAEADAFVIAVLFPAKFSFLTAERGIEDEGVVAWSLVERR